MKPKTVLIIDDDFSVHDRIAATLVKVGFETVSAGNMTSAKAALDLCRVDAMLVDTVLGREDGWDALKELRRISKVPALMLAEESLSEGAADDAVRRGARGILSKPLVDDELTAAVSALF